MDRKNSAIELHEMKFNCAQSAFSVFAEEVGLDRETAIKVATCFGGGMRCGEVCGAVTGILMALGMKCGSSKENGYDKMEAYKKELEFLRKFKERNVHLRCRDLLGYDTSNPEDMKLIVEKGLNKKVCYKAIADAVEIAEEIIR